MKVIFFLVVVWVSCSLGKLEDLDEDNGGPSSEFKPLSYEWTMEDLEYTPYHVQQLRDLRKRSISGEENPLIQNKKDEKFFKALPGVLKKIGGSLEKLLARMKMGGLVTGRIKSVSSLVAKMKQDGITDYREITDIVGLRVTLQTLRDIARFKRVYERFRNKVITEIRCYGVCGPATEVNNPREKIYWPWKGSGYRRLHYKIASKKLETEAEIQIGTPYMTLWAEWSHAVIYKGPDNLKNDPETNSYAKQLAGYYMMLDTIRSKAYPRCPKVLKETSGKSIFSPKDWERCGKPHDACNFWNDLDADM